MMIELSECNNGAHLLWKDMEQEFSRIHATGNETSERASDKDSIQSNILSANFSPTFSQNFSDTSEPLDNRCT